MSYVSLGIARISHRGPPEHRLVSGRTHYICKGEIYINAAIMDDFTGKLKQPTSVMGDEVREY